MTRQKRSSRVLDKAKSRLTGIQSISEKLVINKKLSAQTYNTHINVLTSKLDAYNKVLADADALQIEVNKAESLLANYSEQMLMGVGAEFGKNSAEYERAGGVRKSDRKRPTRRVAVVAG